MLLLVLSLSAALSGPLPQAKEPTGCTTPREACKLFDTFLAALNRRDWEGFRATFDDNITVMFDRPAPPERRDGRAAVEEFFRRIFPDAGSQPRQPPPPVVPDNLLVQDFGDVVVVSFHIRARDEVARRTLVLHRTAKGWRVVHIHASSAQVGG